MRKRALEADVRRLYDVSLDLLCRADFTGRFISINPAGIDLLRTESSPTRAVCSWVSSSRLAGRIVAVAHVFDGLTRERPYRDAWSPGDAVAEIFRGAGSQFDPAVVATFGELWAERAPSLRRYISRAKPPAVMNMNAL